MNRWVIIYRSAWGLLLVLVVIGLICVFLPKCYRMRELQRRKAAIQGENRDFERATKELRLKRDRLKSDPAFVERTARREGMLRRDEVVFKFTDEPEHETAETNQ